MSINQKFEVVAEYKPAGDQPEAIKEIVSNIKKMKITKFFLV